LIQPGRVIGRSALLGARVGHQRLFLYNPGLALMVVDRIRSRHRHTHRRHFQVGKRLDATRAAGR
jgi:hypothetical protein